MLSIHAATTIALLGDGEVYHAGDRCTDGAISKAAQIQEDRQEKREGSSGFFRTDIYTILEEEFGFTALSRYSIDTWAGEIAHEEAAELARDGGEFYRRIVELGLQADWEEAIEYSANPYYGVDIWSVREWFIDQNPDMTTGMVVCGYCTEEIS